MRGSPLFVSIVRVALNPCGVVLEMFLVLVESVSGTSEVEFEWSVCHRAPPFPRYKAADDYAREQARLNGNRYAVVQITKTLQRKTITEVVEETMT